MPNHTLKLLFNKKLDHIEVLYLNSAIRSIGVSMIGIFIPIYLIELNYSLIEVILYYLIVRAVHGLMMIPVSAYASKYGTKRCISTSTIILILFFVLLYQLQNVAIPLGIVAIARGLHNAFFWYGYHSAFASYSDGKHRGEEVGFSRISETLFMVIGPVLGGLILTIANYNVLFIIVGFILALSLIPLFITKDIHNPTKVNIKNIYKGRSIRSFLSYFGHGIESGVIITIWPIFVFFTIIGNYAVLGSISSLQFLFSLILTLIIAQLSDMHRKSILKIGGFVNALIWIIRTGIKTVVQVFVIDSIYGLSKRSLTISFDATSYDKAEQQNIAEHIVFREIVIQLGGVLLFSLLVIFPNYSLSFILASGASLLYILF